MWLKIPQISNVFGANQLAIVMVFIANWILPKNMTLASNRILSFNGYDTYATDKYIFNFRFPLYKKFSSFFENYGQINQNIFQTRYDGGFAYLVNVNKQLDVSAGYGNNRGIKDYFVNTGYIVPFY